LVTEQLQDVNSRRFSTPLHLASQQGHVEVAHFLVENGADATARDKSGQTPLHEASKGGHFAAFEQPGIFVAELRQAFRKFR